MIKFIAIITLKFLALFQTIHMLFVKYLYILQIYFANASFLIFLLGNLILCFYLIDKLALAFCKKESLEIEGPDIYIKSSLEIAVSALFLVYSFSIVHDTVLFWYQFGKLPTEWYDLATIMSLELFYKKVSKTVTEEDQAKSPTKIPKEWDHERTEEIKKQERMYRNLAYEISYNQRTQRPPQPQPQPQLRRTRGNPRRRRPRN